MVDKGMLELIYDSANIQDGESIVEIGGGAGALTDYLVQGNNHVTVIEKDPYYANLLRNRYANMQNVTVVEGDALQFNFQNYDRLVANLPYTITEPFLINLASSGALDYNLSNPKGSTLKSVTLVLSQNSTRKMVAPVQITEGKSRHLNQEFGIMSAICKAFCDLDIITAIPSEAFYPEPAVTSFVVNLTPKKEKTTVDRIMREILMDKKSTHSSIKRIYQLMLSRGEIYKMGKHKNNIDSPLNSSFTSKVIENQNVYDLNHAQVSQLVQDLIRNDISIKSKNSGQRNCRRDDDYGRYFIGNKFAYNVADILDGNDYDDYDDEELKQLRKAATSFFNRYSKDEIFVDEDFFIYFLKSLKEANDKLKLDQKIIIDTVYPFDYTIEKAEKEDTAPFIIETDDNKKLVLPNILAFNYNISVCEESDYEL